MRRTARARRDGAILIEHLKIVFHYLPEWVQSFSIFIIVIFIICVMPLSPALIVLFIAWLTGK
jgi:hypothetical protein